MLRKTLKYDLNAIWKIWLILTVTVLGLSVLCGLGVRDIMVSIGNDEPNPFMFFSIAVVIITVFTVSAYLLIIELLVLFRYYQNFFTDEAYLTFTLPVKRSTLFNSKLINAFIWSLANYGVLFICIFIILLIAPSNIDGSGCAFISIFKSIFKLIGEMFEFFNGWAFIYGLLIIVIALLATVFSTLLIYGCITFGCTMVKKYKLLMAILVYYLVNVGMSVISYIANLVFATAFGTSYNILSLYSDAQISVMILFTLIAAVMFFATLCILTYKLTLGRIERNLNLA